MKKLTISQLSENFLDQLARGAFLTVKSDEKVNTMTIGWGSIGIYWNKPILVVPVRYSRYTYSVIDKCDTFTVSVPINNDLKKELAFCGTKSGRDMDKIKEAGLTLEEGQAVDTPIIAECELHIECKIAYKQSMEPGNLIDEIKTKSYSTNDYHVMYYGEIVAAYIK